jgi:hypothetical protein
MSPVIVALLTAAETDSHKIIERMLASISQRCDVICLDRTFGSSGFALKPTILTSVTVPLVNRVAKLQRDPAFDHAVRPDDAGS